MYHGKSWYTRSTTFRYEHFAVVILRAVLTAASQMPVRYVSKMLLFFVLVLLLASRWHVIEVFALRFRAVVRSCGISGVTMRSGRAWHPPELPCTGEHHKSRTRAPSTGAHNGRPAALFARL